MKTASLVLLALAGCASGGRPFTAWISHESVLSVIDGDTIVIRLVNGELYFDTIRSEIALSA